MLVVGLPKAFDRDANGLAVVVVPKEKLANGLGLAAALGLSGVLEKFRAPNGEGFGVTSVFRFVFATGAGAGSDVLVFSAWTGVTFSATLLVLEDNEVGVLMKPPNVKGVDCGATSAGVVCGWFLM